MQYGISQEQANTLGIKAWVYEDMVAFSNLAMQNFPSDCGAVTISGCNYATLKDLETVTKYCSHSGLNKIIGTIAITKQDDFQAQKEIFSAAGFDILYEGKSNRNPDKNTCIVIKLIQDPVKKGY